MSIDRKYKYTLDVEYQIRADFSFGDEDTIRHERVAIVSDSSLSEDDLWSDILDMASPRYEIRRVLGMEIIKVEKKPEGNVA